MRSYIISGTYSENPLTLHLVVRCEDGTKRRISFPAPSKPYFYVEDPNGEYKSIYGENLRKIEVVNPRDVKSERDKYPRTWESDIPFIERCLIDIHVKKGIDIDTLQPCTTEGINLKIGYMDIETDDSFPITSKDGEILSISLRDENISYLFTTVRRNRININELMDNFVSEIKSIQNKIILNPTFHSTTDLKIIHCNDERELLIRFLQMVPEYDILAGYNIGNLKDDIGFDIPYILERCKRLNIKPKFDETIIFDMMTAYKTLQENDMESFKLDHIANIELGIGKLERKESIRGLYDKNPVKLIIYNYIDTFLLDLLDRKIKIIKFFRNLSEKAGTMNMGKWNSTYIIDSLLFHELNGKLIVPRRSEVKKTDNVKGAFVLEPQNGIFKNVAVLDFKSMYPSQIMTNNISHDAKTHNNEEADVWIEELKIGYRKERGFIPIILENLMKERDSIKERMKSDPDNYESLNMQQRVVKEIMNSFYGMLGSEGARFYDPEIQETITYFSRELISFVADKMREMDGYSVLYGDTDSIMFTNTKYDNMEIHEIVRDVSELREKIVQTFPEFLERYHNHRKSYLDIQFEKLYSKWLQVGSKKKYAGIIIWKGKSVEQYLDVKGFETRRSDRSQYSKTFLMNLLNHIFENREKAWNIYEMEREKWEKHKIDVEQIGIPISIRDSGYKTNYEPYQAFKTSLEEGINLDRNNGKYRMYFLKNKKICINFNDTLPQKYVKMIDWSAHQRRNFDLVLDKIIELIKPEEASSLLSDE